MTKKLSKGTKRCAKLAQRLLAWPGMHTELQEVRIRKERQTFGNFAKSALGLVAPRWAVVRKHLAMYDIGVYVTTCYWTGTPSKRLTTFPVR